MDLIQIPLFPILAYIGALFWTKGLVWALGFLVLLFFALRESLQNLQKLDKELFDTVETIGITIDAKDRYTREHSERVSEYAVIIAKYCGLDDIDIERIRHEAKLHDVGKLLLNDEVLKKPDALTAEEYNHIKQHTFLDEVLLDHIPKDFPIAKWIDIARLHHERYDGKGYPKGLKGEEIPMDARIISVADAWDAMTSNRVYRQGLPDKTALKILKDYSQVQWDPGAVNAFLKAYEEGKIQAVMPPPASTQEAAGDSVKRYHD